MIRDGRVSAMGREGRRPPPFYTRGRWSGSLLTARRRLHLRGKRMRQLVQRWTGGEPERLVIFVAGVHRSGTNMMMQTLEWHPQTDVYRESDPRAFDGFLMRPEPVIDALIARSPATRVVVKALHETERLCSLLERYAPARAIWMYRDWRDVVNSILSRWPGHRNGVDRIMKGIDTAGWRGRGMTEATRAELERFYRPDLDDASVNALFWVFRNQIFFDQGFDRDPRMALISYDRILEHSRSQIGVLAAFLNIEYNERMVQVPDVGRVRTKAPPVVEPDIAAFADRMLERLDGAWRASPFGEAGGRGTADLLSGIP